MSDTVGVYSMSRFAILRSEMKSKFIECKNKVIYAQLMMQAYSGSMVIFVMLEFLIIKKFFNWIVYGS